LESRQQYENFKPTNHYFSLDWYANRKRRSDYFAESEQMASMTNKRGKAAGSGSSVMDNTGREEDDSKPSPVIGSAVHL
jgi:hypothetical protein